MIISHAQVAAIKTLRDHWSSHSFVLIGGSALALQSDEFWRTTRDLDLVVAVGVEELEQLALLEGWSRDRHEHEWVGPGGVRIDVVPAGPELLEEGAVIWSDGHRMSLVGIRHAFDLALQLDMGSGCIVPVAPRHVIALLKMISFMDRPSDRERDLVDLAYMLEKHITFDDDRWFSEDVPSGLEVREIPSYLLGLDIGRLVDSNEAAVVSHFLERVGDGGASHATMLVNGPWRRDPDELLLRLDAFRDGFREGSERPVV